MITSVIVLILGGIYSAAVAAWMSLQSPEEKAAREAKVNADMMATMLNHMAPEQAKAVAGELNGK